MKTFKKIFTGGVGLFLLILFFPIKTNYLFSQQFYVTEVYGGRTYAYKLPLENWNQLFIYFPDIYCSNGSYTFCSNPNKLYLLGLGTTACSNGATDTLYKYVCKNDSGYCDLNSPTDWQWEKELINFNPCKNNYCNSHIDQYAEPTYIYANGKHFIFFTNPNGDHNWARGRIFFRYSTNGTDWSQDYLLLEIANENIKSCNCRGGFARPSVIFKDGYFYLYFEVWREANLYQTCCPAQNPPPEADSIGNHQQFLAKFTYKNDYPYISFSNNSAFVYKKNSDKWINLGCKLLNPIPTGEPTPPSILCDNFIFGWNINPDNDPLGPKYPDDCPSQYGYTYPSGEMIKFVEDSIFPTIATDSLGDVSLRPDGRSCIGIFHTFNDDDPDYDHMILTMESGDCIHFQEPYPLLNWELLGLDRYQLAHTGPSLFPWNSTWEYKRYLMAYSFVPPPNQWHEAYVKLAKIERYVASPKPAPKPIKFIKLRLKDSLSYYDTNNDGILDNEIILPIDSSYEGIINSLQPIAYEEQGFYRVKAYYAYCYYKNKNKIRCVVDDDKDMEGIGLDEDQNVIYFKKGFFEAGDELEIQLILRAYMEEKPKDKVKKCKKDDTCINIKLKFKQ